MILTNEQQDDCIPVHRQLMDYCQLITNTTPETLPDNLKRQTVEFLLYGRNIAKAQDKLSRKDEREKMAAWLERVTSGTSMYEAQCEMDNGILDLSEGKAPWSDDG